MTFTSSILPVLTRIAIRLGAFALGLVAYDWAYSQAVQPTPGDADIGKGLLAFLALVLVSFAWAMVDGIRHRFVATAVVWLVVAVGFAVGWEVVLLAEVDEAGASFAELARADLGSVLFTVQLLFAPALVGATLGWLIQRGNVAASPPKNADPALPHA